MNSDKGTFTEITRPRIIDMPVTKVFMNNSNLKDNIPMLPRQPRIGTNTRNKSNIVFSFGKNLDYTDKNERYVVNAACEYEKKRSQNNTIKQLQRYEFKRYLIFS